MKNECINKTKIACILNCIIFILSIIAFLIMFTGYKITYIKEPVLETTKFGVFKFFTVDSNLFMGIIAIILAHKEKQLLLKEKKDISTIYYLLKMIATISVSLTMLVVFVYLAKIADGGLISLLQNSNMFFHFIIPSLSIITFVLFERTNKIKFGYVIYGIVPVILYGIFYITNILIHLEDGKVSPKYDWYYFVQNGIDKAFYVAGGIIIVTYIVGLFLWILNKKHLE